MSRYKSELYGKLLWSRQTAEDQFFERRSNSARRSRPGTAKPDAVPSAEQQGQPGAAAEASNISRGPATNYVRRWVVEGGGRTGTACPVATYHGSSSASSCCLQALWFKQAAFTHAADACSSLWLSGLIKHAGAHDACRTSAKNRPYSACFATTHGAPVSHFPADPKDVERRLLEGALQLSGAKLTALQGLLKRAQDASRQAQERPQTAPSARRPPSPGPVPGAGPLHATGLAGSGGLPVRPSTAMPSASRNASGPPQISVSAQGELQFRPQRTPTTTQSGVPLPTATSPGAAAQQPARQLPAWADTGAAAAVAAGTYRSAAPPQILTLGSPDITQGDGGGLPSPAMGGSTTARSTTSPNTIGFIPRLPSPSSPYSQPYGHHSQGQQPVLIRGTKAALKQELAAISARTGQKFEALTPGLAKRPTTAPSGWRPELGLVRRPEDLSKDEARMTYEEVGG